jgi:RNA polymerase sigma-70 factor (ECF subfamily)
VVLGAERRTNRRPRKEPAPAVANMEAMSLVTAALPVVDIARPRRATPPAYPHGKVHHAAAHSRYALGDDAQAWLRALRGPPAIRDAAVAELHAMLVRGAHHELGRRRGTLVHLPASEIDDLATQAANDALVAIIAKLHTFRGASRFTTWAYKFVLLEAGVKARRRAWHGREVVLEAQAWALLADASPGAPQTVEEHELLGAIRDAVQTELTPHQREVFSAVALNGVPIDVLAERLATTRGALYKTLHDARRKLRAALTDAGYSLDDHGHTGGGA